MMIKRVHGLSLLELLMVIVVMAVIVTMGVFAYHQLSPRVKAYTTARLMQGVAQAAQRYRDVNGTWPAALACPTTELPTDPTVLAFIDHYVPNAAVISPFGATDFICWGYDGATPGNTNPRLYVAYPASSPEQAQRIATNLPNSVLTHVPAASDPLDPANACSATGPCYVRIAITAPVPNSVAPLSQSNLYAAGQCSMADGDGTETNAVYGATTSCTFAGLASPEPRISTFPELHYTITTECPAEQSAFLHVGFDPFIAPVTNPTPGEVVVNAPARLQVDYTDNNGIANTHCTGTGTNITCNVYVLATAYSLESSGTFERLINDPVFATSGQLGLNYLSFCS